MNKSQTNIIVIEDDERFRGSAVLFLIGMHYETVKFCLTMAEGIAFLTSHLDEKNIIILDYQLSQGEMGNEVLHVIRKDISKLVPVIFWTANTIQEIAEIISDKTYAVVSKTESSETLLSIIKQAENELNHTIEGALEEWLVLEKGISVDPYLIKVSKQELTIKEILNELRLQTPTGQKFEKNLLMLTIDLLLRRKEKLND